MKKLFFLAMASACLTGIAPAMAETWTITTTKWEPAMSEELPEGGYAISLLRTILKSEGIDLAVKFYPWTRTVQTARDPKYLGYYSAYYEEVEPGFTKSADIFGTSLAFVEQTKKPLSWKNLTDLKGKKFAYPQDGGTTDEFMAAVKKGDIILETHAGIDAELITIKKIVGERADAGIINPQTFEYYLSMHPEFKGQVQLNSHLLQDNKPNVLAINNNFPNKNAAEIVKRGLSKVNVKVFVSDYMKKYFGK